MKAGLFLLGLAMAAPASAAGKTAADLGALVREHNPRVQSAQFFVEAARRRGGEWGRSFLPDVHAEAGREAFRTGTEERRTEPFSSVAANMNVFQGGRARLQGLATQAEIRESEAEYETTLREQLQSARETFWTVVFQRELAGILTAALGKNNSYLESANKRITSGLATSTDRLEFEINKHQLEQDLARLRAERAQAEKTLTLLTGTTPEAFEFPLAIPHQHDNRPAADLNVADHPAVRAALLRGENRSLSARALNRWWTPSIDLFSSYSLYTFREREFERREDRDETVVGGKVSIALFDGFKSRAEANALNAQTRAYEQERQLTEHDLRVRLESAYQFGEELHELIHSAEESVALSEQYLKSTLTEYARGVKNSPDVISALEKKVEMDRRYAEIRRDYQLHRATLLALQGE